MSQVETQTANPKPNKEGEDFINKKWRPLMGWSYMITCVCDFVLFPVLWSLLQTMLKQPLTQWNPITLQGAGLYHVAMGAVLGITAFGRTQEKIAGASTTPTTATPRTSGLPPSTATSGLPPSSIKTP